MRVAAHAACLGFLVQSLSRRRRSSEWKIHDMIGRRMTGLDRPSVRFPGLSARALPSPYLK
jgi:hypothetical protein